MIVVASLTPPSMAASIIPNGSSDHKVKLDLGEAKFDLGDRDRDLLGGWFRGGALLSSLAAGDVAAGEEEEEAAAAEGDGQRRCLVDLCDGGSWEAKDQGDDAISALCLLEKSLSALAVVGEAAEAAAGGGGGRRGAAPVVILAGRLNLA
ncbi:hypothetical protein CRG98_036387 [Punica granatum]|uniref:Uncharacterized protein n=1 Tax=Punica granatum TaxID=22663 RepID=A0A2I0IGT7_PUNGR|nr:hypothetical protein CRG98_036387 [Punica granatum]